MMEQMQTPVSMPHIVQVYQTSHPSLQTQGKITYQQTMTSAPIHIPVSSQVHDVNLISQSQAVMSCPPIHLQSIQTPLHTQIQSQVIHGAELSQSLQITSHVILPQVPVFKQHLLTNTIQHQYYGQYDTYVKETPYVIAKVEPNIPVVTNLEASCKPEIGEQVESIGDSKKKKTRSQIPNPSKWACNVRKLKHQRGEAYISRRGKYVPERHIRNTKDCLKSCRYKCNEIINDVDRQHIFKAFYSLNSNEKKYFLLNTTERNDVKRNKIVGGSFKRKYTFKYFFLVRAVRYTVCKNFYLGTLAISQKPVYNVHLGKSEINLPKRDGRGLSEASTHSLPSEVKDRVRNHIMSFTTIDSKSIKQFSRKKQYLDSCLSIRQMYSMYSNECNKNNVPSVKESMYRKIFKQEFNLHFKKHKRDLCERCKGRLKKT